MDLVFGETKVASSRRIQKVCLELNLFSLCFLAGRHELKVEVRNANDFKGSNSFL